MIGRRRRIMRDRPRPERKALAAWYRHVERTAEDLKRAADTPPWWTRMWSSLGGYFGFSLRGELRGLSRWLLDLDEAPRWVTLEEHVLERAASEAAIVATALRLTPADRWDYEARLRLSRRLDGVRAQLEARLLTQQVGEPPLESLEALMHLHDLG
jgi:hypothetical protein